MTPKQELIHNAVLNGKSPVPVAKLATDGPRFDKNIKCVRTNERIIEENLVNFEKVELDRLEPYRVIREAMRAKKHADVKVLNDEGVVVTVTVEVPDHTTRLAAARQWMFLTGKELSRAAIQINNNGNGSQNVLIGDIYEQILRMPSESEQLTAFNDLQRKLQKGEVNTALPEPSIEAEYAELPDDLPE